MDVEIEQSLGAVEFDEDLVSTGGAAELRVMSDSSTDSMSDMQGLRAEEGN